LKAQEQQHAAKLAEVEALLLQERTARYTVEHNLAQAVETSSQSAAQLVDLGQHYHTTQEAHMALVRENEALKGRAASLEQFLLAHQGLQMQGQRDQIQKLQNIQAERRETIQAPVSSLNGSSLRSRVAQRMEQGDFKAEGLVDGQSDAVDANEIRSANYPLNMNERVRDSIASEAQKPAPKAENQQPRESPQASVPRESPQVSVPRESPQVSVPRESSQASVPRVSLSSIAMNSAMKEADQHKKDREARLASLTASWDTEVSRVHSEDEDHRNNIAMFAKQASLSKHMDAMQDILNRATS